MADPGFPRGGGANPKGGEGHQHTIWPFFLWKLYQNKEILGQGGSAHVPRPLPPPPDKTLVMVLLWLSWFRARNYSHHRNIEVSVPLTGMSCSMGRDMTPLSHILTSFSAALSAARLQLRYSWSGFMLKLVQYWRLVHPIEHGSSTVQKNTKSVMSLEQSEILLMTSWPLNIFIL